MCGTLTRTISTDEIVAALNIRHVIESLPPAYNTKPTMQVMIVYEENRERVLRIAHWWLTPQWLKNKGLIEFYTNDEGRKTYRWKGSPISMFNLRHDNVTNPEKPTWRAALSNKRSIIISDGFVEWPDDKMRDKKKDKIPGYFQYNDHAVHGLAGFHECIKDDEGKDFHSSCLITVDPNRMLQALPHHRMPAMLRGSNLDTWLDSSMTDPDLAASLCHTTPDEEMSGYFISKAANVAKNSTADVLRSIGTFDEDNTVISARNNALGY